MQVNEIIAQLGGIRPTANKLGVAVSTVQGWKERDRIPAERVEQIEKILGTSLNMEKPAPKTQQTPYAENTEKSPKIDKNNQKTPKNDKKTSRNGNFLIFSALGVSAISLALVITGDLWRGKLFPKGDKIAKIEQKIAKIDEKIQKIDEKSQNSLNLSQGVFDKIRDLEAISQANSLKIDTADKKITGMLEINNEKVIKIRQITTTALAGVNYSLLLNNIDADTDESKGALEILKQNSTGIYTRAMLIRFVSDNILELSSALHMKTADNPWKKLTAKLKSVIYVRQTTQNQNDEITKLINAIQNDNIDGALAVLSGTNTESATQLKGALINRKYTIGALITLNNWAVERKGK